MEKQLNVRLKFTVDVEVPTDRVEEAKRAFDAALGIWRVWAMFNLPREMIVTSEIEDD